MVIGLAKEDLSRVCQSTALIAQCARGQLSECIGEQIGIAGFNEIINISRNCCPDRNNAKCSIRDEVIQKYQCFAADSLVTLADGKQKTIADLRSGDQLIAFNHNTQQLVTTALITMMDFQPHNFALFKHITTSTGRQLSLTSSHLLPTPNNGYLMAKNIESGMNIYVVNEEGALIEDRVSNVTDVVKQGYMAPLTQEGTLIVNHVAASCYATIDSHDVAHAVLAPMRWWYNLFGAGSKRDETRSVGVHWFPKALLDLTLSVFPSIVHHS